MSEKADLIQFRINSEKKSSNEKKEKSESLIIIGHHACPDGLAGILVFADKYGLDDNMTYAGLNHSDAKTMEEQIKTIIQKQPKDSAIVFVDIIPPFSILKILLENSTSKITLLDHHATAIAELESEENKKTIDAYVKSGRLVLDLDVTRSGAGIAYDFVHGKTEEKPLSISLVQTIDLLTATANPEVIKQFKLDKKSISEQNQKMLERLAKQVTCKPVLDNLEFYVLAAGMDEHIKFLFKQHQFQMNKDLILAVRTFFAEIDKKGINYLFDLPIPCQDGTVKSVETLFSEQLAYQKNALANAVIFPSLHNPEMDILFLNANIQCGRTFDPMIAEALIKESHELRPMIAMVGEVPMTSGLYPEKNWVALRGAHHSIDLKDVAFQYKEKSLVMNAGGHARASALQFNREQLSAVVAQFSHKKSKLTMM